MVMVTDKAAAILHATLEANAQEDTQVLRLTATPEGFGLSLDQEQDGDEVVTHEERKVLVIDQNVAQTLEGGRVDAVDTPEGTRLVLESAQQQQQQ